MNAIPILTLKRLPVYLDLLYKYQRAGMKTVSATRIADSTDVHMTQVRKDLAFTGVVGIPKVGHRITELISAIEQCLNWNDVSSCFLVGVGHLGKALLGYSELSRKGLRIIAAFDLHPETTGEYLHGVPIYGMEKMPNLLSRLHVHIGILCTPSEAAQEVAEQMLAGGVIAIWNFTPVKLDLPEDVIIENIDMSSSLAVLSRRVAERMMRKTS
ncbi:MAG TPA: redox-sensing transcriptional repressor Rex [Candidatus Cloacimonadota bacterium]|nr:redox-sensing transcriptional repressor Rex [Candidatus Cloacimonadota bacterium]